MINVEDKVKIAKKLITDEDRLQCQCGGCLVVEKITKEYKIKNNNECIIEDIPILQCSNCKKEVSNLSLFVKEVIKSSLQVLEESSISNKKFKNFTFIPEVIEDIEKKINSAPKNNIKKIIIKEIKTSIPSDWLNYRSQIEYSKQPFLTDIEIKGVK